MKRFDAMITLDHGQFKTDGQPHPDARRVWGLDLDGDGSKQAGWLMPQVSEVDPKTARFKAQVAARTAAAKWRNAQ